MKYLKLFESYNWDFYIQKINFDEYQLKVYSPNSIKLDFTDRELNLFKIIIEEFKVKYNFDILFFDHVIVTVNGKNYKYIYISDNKTDIYNFSFSIYKLDDEYYSICYSDNYTYNEYDTFIDAFDDEDEFEIDNYYIVDSLEGLKEFFLNLENLPNGFPPN